MVYYFKICEGKFCKRSIYLHFKQLLDFMINNRLAYNYASALFSNACANKLEEETLDQIKSIDGIIENDKQIKHFMVSPIIDYHDKLKLIKMTIKNLKLVSIERFLLILLKYSRMSILSKIVMYYEKLLNERENIKMVKVTSSKLLAADEKNWLRQYLERNFQHKTIINFKQDSSILGGIIVRYDDMMEDYSLAGILKKISKTLKSSEI